MTLPFPKSGAHTSHLSACFQPAVCLEPKFPQNSHVSHIWHHLGIFREGCVWLEAFLARFEHVSPVSHYVSTPTTCRLRLCLLHFWAGSVDTFGGNFDLWRCVCVMGTIMDPLREQSCIERLNLCARRPDNDAGQRGWGQHLVLSTIATL